MERYDVVVVGVGGMGSAALYHLARRGKRVLGLERFDLLHEHGSSHGLTRIIRLAYFEHSDYVPLLRRAYELWRELETEAGEPLLYVTGIIEGGERITEGVLRSCADHGLDHEVLSGAEIARRFPAYQLPLDAEVVYQPDGGFVVPERCIVAHVNGALARGACCERASGCSSGTRRRAASASAPTAERSRRSGSSSRQARGRRTSRVCRSARSRRFARPSPGSRRRRPELFTPERMPVFNLVIDGDHFYGFPAHGIPGVKLGRYERQGETGDPDTISREATIDDEVPLRAFAERYLPEGAGPTVALKTCLFELSPDEHFLVDRHPECENVVVGAGFSGHGFKFCSVVGEILADLALDGETRHDIGLFRLDRFSVTDDAGGRTRTSKDLAAQRDLNPPRLPIPPRPRGIQV